MNVLQYAAKIEATFKAHEADLNYEPISTFASDFAIADFFTLKENELQHVKDTFDAAFDEWKNDTKMFTELTIVMNWLCWFHFYSPNPSKTTEELSALYADYFYKCKDYVYDNWKRCDIDYFFRITD